MRHSSDQAVAAAYCSMNEKSLNTTECSSGLPRRSLLFAKMRRLSKANPGSVRSSIWQLRISKIA